jgi:hypothetical protein
MLVIYFFVGLIILLAVWFVSFTYKKRSSGEKTGSRKSEPDDKDNDDVMYR